MKPHRATALATAAGALVVAITPSAHAMEQCREGRGSRPALGVLCLGLGVGLGLISAAHGIRRSRRSAEAWRIAWLVLDLAFSFVLAVAGFVGLAYFLWKCAPIG